MDKQIHGGAVRWQDGTYDPYHDQYREIFKSAKAKTYLDWLATNGGGRMDDGVMLEPLRANPDQLVAPEDFGPVLTEEQDELRHEAYAQFSEKQQIVWDLAMRQGLSEEAIAKRLDISHQAVHGLISRAKATFTNFIRERTNG